VKTYAAGRVLVTRKALSTLTLLAASLLLSLITAGAASAGIQQEYAAFSDCPLSSPSVTYCLVSNTSSGEFHLGSKVVPINRTITLQGGLHSVTGATTLIPAADGNTLSRTALELPGGLIGIELLGPLTGVTATAELAGAVNLNLTSFSKRTGTAVGLPLKVKLDNPLLGGACYIGSSSEPVAPQLTSGTTSPPSPNKPISGSSGTFTFTGGGTIISITGGSLVDNAFSAPGANGCGGLLAFLIDPAVDLIAGVPAAAGHNTAILNSEFQVAQARIVKVEQTLPEIGRCEKVGKTGGAYVDSGCIEGSEEHGGKYEWAAGPGTEKAFSGTGKALTLETASHSQLKCAQSETTGEYTGTKTASLAVTLTGCKLTATKETCQSTATAGEIRIPSLQGKLGFITDKSEGMTAKVSVGFELRHEPTILSAQCGAAKEAVVVTGAVIAGLSPIDKMTAKTSLLLAAEGGKQSPQQFEGGAGDRLFTEFGAHATEESVLTGKASIAGAAKLEVRAEAR
jgi:hypothetical protein